MTGRLTGLRLIVTGASAAGAEGLCATLLEAGAGLVLWDRDPAMLERLAAALPGAVWPMVVDPDRADQVRGASAGAGTVDAVVAFFDGPVLRETLAQRPGYASVPVVPVARLGADPVAALISIMTTADRRD